MTGMDLVQNIMITVLFIVVLGLLFEKKLPVDRNGRM